MEPQLQDQGVYTTPLNPGADVLLDVAAMTRRMVAGEEAAYRLFYEAYFNRLFRFLLVLTRGNEDQAREALQATLVRLVRHIRVFHDDSVFWSWLTVLARTALVDQIRKRARYLALLDRFFDWWRVERALPEPDSSQTALLALLDQNLSELPFDERELLKRKYFAHESVQQIASDLRTTEKAVESRLVRVRRKLRASLLRSLKNE